MTDTVDTATEAPTLSRREAQKEAKRTALIDAALDVFSRVGFAAAKMDDVAEEAGVSKGTVYLYFDSKEKLFEGMVKEKMSPMLNEVTSVLSQNFSSATERLKAHMKLFYTRIVKCDRRQITRLIMAEGPNFPHLAEFYYANVLSRGQAIINGILEQGIEAGEFRDMSREGLTQNIVAGALVASIWTLVFNRFEPLDLDAYFETHIDLILNGLRASD